MGSPSLLVTGFPRNRPIRNRIEELPMPKDQPLIRYATTFYRTEKGTQDVHQDLEEIVDLHDLVERGYHWDTIEKIEVVRVNHCTDPNLTIEQSLKL
jgi:hypothetical protein